ncbi:MAG: hypothetical protein Q9193_004769, partial [Seirophora villosa]
MATVVRKRSTVGPWSAEFDTVRREKLFRKPPRDRTAYPSLVDAIQPHVQSFNALFGDTQLLAAGIKDIGTKVFLDGRPEGTLQNAHHEDPTPLPHPRNRLSVRIRGVFLEKAVLPPTNKY